MTTPGHDIDANFFSLIHNLVGPPGPDESVERRTHERQPFQSIQRIAARRGLALPDESEFFEVRCHDLTGGGFSFLLTREPDFDSLVATFGTPPKAIYIAARVTHRAPVLVYPTWQIKRLDAPAGVPPPENPAAMPMVLVGCRFTERF